MITAKHFKEQEFARCNPPCSLQDMEQETMDKLDAAREDMAKQIASKEAKLQAELV